MDEETEMLTKTERLLKRLPREVPRVVDFADHYTAKLSFDEDTWRDMGAPDEITVTIEPGDRLNP